MPIDSPRIVQTEPLHFAALHLIIPVSEIRQVMGPGLNEVWEALHQQEVSPSGPWFTHHYHRPLETFDFELCLPVAAPIKPFGRIQPGVWPAMRAARTIFHGNYSGLPAAWGEFEGWTIAQQGRPGTEFWERYLIGPEQNKDPNQWQTELNWPLL